MNIVVRTSTGNYIVRPDTTRSHEGDDFYSPEGFDSFSYSPVVFARICKAGRSVGEKFASRYFDYCSYGVLLYPDRMLDGSETGYACASCMDHSSLLPLTMFGKEDKREFVLNKDDLELFHGGAIALETIEKAICEASRYIYLRIGDLLAIELKPRSPLCSRGEGGSLLRACYGDTELMGTKIIF